MPQTITYRPIEPADCAAVAQLHQQSFSTKDVEASIFLSPKVGNYLAQLVAFPQWQPEHWLLGAWDGETLIGYVFGRPLPTSWHLNYLAVSPQRQGNGVGQTLWAKWHQAGSERGYDCFTVDVEQDNKRARDWYGRMGYDSVDVTHIYYRNLRSTASSPTVAPRLVNWENARAWQEQYGFSQFEIVVEEGKWAVGQLADKYFRVVSPLPASVEGVLHQLDSSRQLLLMSEEPLDDAEELKISLRLKCVSGKIPPLKEAGENNSGRE